MSSVLFLADDKSPVIQYDTGWSYGNSGDDGLADQLVVFVVGLRLANDKFFSGTFAARSRRQT
jgi:hemolysin activation/secretion protein